MVRIFAAALGIALVAAVGGAFLRALMTVRFEPDIFYSVLPAPTPVELDVSGGVVPHHLLAKEIIEDFFRKLSGDFFSSNGSMKAKPETVIVLSPDHFNTANVLGHSKFIAPAIITQTIDGLAVDAGLLENLYNADILVQGESFIAVEHGITALLPFVKKYLPDVRIVPLLVPGGLKRETVERLVETIGTRGNQKSIIIASVDFSHYFPENVAQFHDVKSISVLLDFRSDEFKSLEVDCWQCLYAVRKFAKLRGREYPEIIAHKNSVDFWKGKPLEETTSYFSVIFKKENDFSAKIADFKGYSVIFVGDIMLGRTVGSLMNKNGFAYPFEKIKPFLTGVDIVFGNLEGPISVNPSKFPANSLKFSFSPAAAESLYFGGVKVVSLANNHLLDNNQTGLAETKDILKKSGIDFVGDPLKCGSEFSFRRANLIFLAFNKTYPSVCSEKEIFWTIKTLKHSTPESYLAVSIHWGEEYHSLSSPAQRKLGRLMIDAGADAVFGHHPHVVQEIEIYRQKPIFYSLGNFIFDQYFSQETQQGLAVGAEIFPNRVVYRLFPVKSQLSQPILMTKEERHSFLEELASKSASDLAQFIKDGKIEIKTQ